ncbi:MAG: S4 domain-containing protein, partial [Oceanobacter sp.]
MKERIQKLLAVAAVASSRREAERWIADGRVSVNGKIAQLGDRADHHDDLRVDGRPIKLDDVGKNR